mgnify:CR=1 FL=1
MVEWSITAVLKTVELKGSGGSNPSLSANNLKLSAKRWAFFVQGRQELAPVRTCAEKLKGRKAVSFKSFARAPRRAARDVAHKVRQIPRRGRDSPRLSSDYLLQPFRCQIFCANRKQCDADRMHTGWPFSLHTPHSGPLGIRTQH